MFSLTEDEWRVRLRSTKGCGCLSIQKFFLLLLPNIHEMHFLFSLMAFDFDLWISHLAPPFWWTSWEVGLVSCPRDQKKRTSVMIWSLGFMDDPTLPLFSLYLWITVLSWQRKVLLALSPGSVLLLWLTPGGRWSIYRGSVKTSPDLLSCILSISENVYPYFVHFQTLPCIFCQRPMKARRIRNFWRSFLDPLYV